MFLFRFIIVSFFSSLPKFYKRIVINLFVDGFVLQTLEGSNGDETDEGVKLSLSIFIFVTTTAHADTNATGDILDTLGPNVLVEFGVDTDIRGSQGFQSESLDGLDGRGGALLKRLAVNVFVKVNGVFTSDDFSSRSTFISSHTIKRDGMDSGLIYEYI